MKNLNVLYPNCFHKNKRLLIRIHFLRILFFLLTLATSSFCFAQETQVAKKDTTSRTIWDIPHRTLWQLWMWPHRSVVFEIIKERPVNYNPAYVKYYNKQLVITLPLSTRFLRYSLSDPKSGNKLVFAPNLQYDLGVSVSSRWATFIFNTGVKLFNQDNDIKGKTNYQDYQLNIYGRKVTTDMFVQYYSGFYIKNSKSYSNYISDQPYSIRSDVNAIHMGVSSYFILNHKKFSYRNSFAFVEQQKKSAGSLLIGIYYSYFETGSGISLINAPFRSSFDTLSFIKNGRTNNFGLNVGYIYTLVFLKKCYATASFVQGIGGEVLHYTRDNGTTFNKLDGGAGKLHVRLALGYDPGKYFIGTMGMFDYFLFSAKSNSTFDYSYGKFMLYVGYRFSILKTEQKVLRRLKLVDYW